ncbi:protein neprosin-like [Apium graveolens]|uniref:protein neprosin-like n=1 Tax=Apium graveolens TaxID=4045 RepID=UPI003D7928AE
MVLQSEDGDIIDCIDILKQPAFSHPALKNHTILMKPNNDPKKKSAESETTHWTRKENIERNIVTSQVWHRKGITCPNGTVPIRRVQEFNNFPKNKHGRKNLTYHQLMQSTDTVNLMLANHSTAVLIAEGYSYTAGKGDMVVWNPNVESDDEYSTFSCITQKWSSARVRVNPSVYGDHQTRLFAYWTADSSKKTGCFDQTCPGFVQTNSKIALGAAIHPISGPNGLPYKISIYIYKDFITNNWWLQYGDNINIGYWPPELFKMLWYQANLVEWGGEVYSTRIGAIHPHTATAMGSGQYSDPTGHWITSGQITRKRA